MVKTDRAGRREGKLPHSACPRAFPSVPTTGSGVITDWSGPSQVLPDQVCPSPHPMPHPSGVSSLSPVHTRSWAKGTAHVVPSWDSLPRLTAHQNWEGPGRKPRPQSAQLREIWLRHPRGGLNMFPIVTPFRGYLGRYRLKQKGREEREKEAEESAC